MIQLYVTYPGSSTVQLDTFDQEPIKINLQVEDFLKLGGVAGSYSRTFRIPFTAKNERFFKMAFNVNQSGFFDATLKCPAWIESDGFFFTNGNLRLSNVYTNERESTIVYECVFMGETNDFSSAVGNEFLNEINLSAYSHAQSISGITGSWAGATAGSTAGYTGGLVSGNVVYPLIEWGYSYSKDNQPDIPTLTEGYPSSFTQNTWAFRQEQFKPAVKVKLIWDKIFEDAGYGYTGAFLNSARFKALYMVSDSLARTSAIVDNKGKCIGDMEPIYLDAGDIGTLTNVASIPSDPGNNFSAVDGGYTIPATGNYTFNFFQQYQAEILVNPADVIFTLYNIDTGLQIGTGSYTKSLAVGTCSGTAHQSLSLTSVDQGTRVAWQVEFNAEPGSDYSTSYSSWEVTSTPDFLNPGTILPANIKKIDFIKSIVDKFRLVMVPDKDNAKMFKIEPWVDWIQQGDLLDWNSKLDGSKDFKTSPLFYTQPRETVYQDAEDTDYVNHFYLQNYKKPYGQYKLDSGIELIKGTETVTGIFAPTPLDSIACSATGGITGAAKFIIPHLAKDNAPDENVGKREPIQPKPRLLFYNGVQTAPITWYMKNDAGTTATFNTYPLMSNFETWPPTGTTLDLNWQNYPPIFNAVVAEVTGTSNKTVYTEYWKTWHENYYDPYSRIAEGTFYLTDQDVSSLNFNDRLSIKDTQWFPVKVSDHTLGKREPTKVTMIKVGNVNVGPGTGGTSGTGTNNCSACNTWATYNPYNYSIILYSKDCYTLQIISNIIPPHQPKWVCSCSDFTPYSNAQGIKITFVQGWCGFNQGSGPTGGTGGVTGTYYTLSNSSKEDQPVEFLNCQKGVTDTYIVSPFSVANIVSCNLPTGPTGVTDLVITTQDLYGLTGPVFVAAITDTTTAFDGDVELFFSKDGSYFESIGWTGTFSGLVSIPEQVLYSDNYLYARATFTKTVDGGTGSSQIGLLLADNEPIYQYDISSMIVSDSLSIDTPTIINGISYTFLLKNYS